MQDNPINNNNNDNNNNSSISSVNMYQKNHNDSMTSWIRSIVLVLLCVQNAGHALMTRYSQGILNEEYSPTEVVLTGELIKLIVSAYLALVDTSDTDSQGSGIRKLLWLLLNSKKIVVLVVLYSFANVITYFALARVEAAVYTVLLQLKILTTASFAVIMLGRNISSNKWRALFLLALGCVLVASPAFNQPVSCPEIPVALSKHDIIEAAVKGQSSTLRGVPVSEPQGSESTVMDSLAGVLAILIMVAISGYTAVYFEAMLKVTGEKVTIWERNFQLAFYSLALLVVVICWENSGGADSTSATSADTSFRPFRGWTINTVIITCLQASGGLLVAATLKYADAILKTLATAGAIVLSAILGHMLLGATLDLFVAIGCVSTILAIFNYSLDQ